MLREHDAEPTQGLPEALPTGEQILWQGAPDWRVLARRALLTRAVAIYFAVLMLWRFGAALNDGAGLLEAFGLATALLPLAAGGVGVLALIAYATAKSTIYTITNRRVILRYGVAMTLCVNVPFRAIASAALRPLPRRHGDIPLKLATSDKFSYMMLWPNARPWRFGAPEPMLRAVPEAAHVATVLAEALRAFHDADPVNASGERAHTTTAAPTRVAAALAAE